MPKVLVFSDGTQIAVTSDKGKFWETEKAQFRKSNPQIVDVIEATVSDDKKAENSASSKKRKAKDKADE